MILTLTRRQTLQSLATATVFASGAGGLILSLAGCGGGGGTIGGGGGNVRLKTSSVKAKIVLPEGVNIAASSLRVATVAGSATPNASGEVAVTVLNGGPQYAEARDARGNLVLAGFIDSKQTTLDAASTAQVLATLGLGVAAITGPARPKVVESLRTATGFSDLVAAVASRLKSTGMTTIGDPAIEAKLDAMYSAAGGGTRAVGRGHGSTRGTIVEPTTNPSGIAVDTSVDGELRMKNVRLRRAIAWIDTTSHQVKKGDVTTTVPAAKPTEPPKVITIDPPKRFGGTIGTFKDVIENAVNPDAPLPYTPVEVGPFPIPAVVPSVAGCVATEYKLSIVGPGLTAGDIAKLDASRRARINRVYFDGFLLDYFLPVVTTVVIPFLDDELDAFLKFSSGNAILGDFVNTVFSTAPAVGTAMSEGRYYDALITLRDAGLLSGTFLPLITQLFIQFVEKNGSERLAGQADKFFGTASAIFGTVGKLDKGLSLAENLVVGADFVRSNRGDVLKVLSTGGKVSLGASRPILPANASSNIRAIIQDKNPDAVYKYEWSVSAGFRLNDSFGKNTDDAPGGILVSSQENVAIIAKDLKPGLASVTCKVTRTDGEPDVPIAQGTGDILFTATFTLGASQTRIKKGETSVLTAKYNGTEEVEWAYSIGSGTGTLSPTGRTKSKTTTLTAGQTDGPIQVVAECFVKAEGEFYSIGTTGAVVTVGTRVVVTNASGKTVSGVHAFPPGTYGDRSNTQTIYKGAAVRVVEFSPVPGATHYEVFDEAGNSLLLGPPLISPERAWWEEFKPSGVIWGRVAYSSPGYSFETNAGTAATNAGEAAAYLNETYGTAKYELRITY